LTALSLLTPPAARISTSLGNPPPAGADETWAAAGPAQITAQNAKRMVFMFHSRMKRNVMRPHCLSLAVMGANFHRRRQSMARRLSRP